MQVENGHSVLRKKEKVVKVELNVEYFEEDGAIVALCPDLQVSSFGDTIEEAERSIQEALELFFDGCQIQGTTDEVLEESGFQSVNGTGSAARLSR